MMIRNSMEFINVSEQVKNCPFCGGSEIFISRYNSDVGERFGIFCTGCMAGIDRGYDQNKHTIIEAWNKRA